MSPPFPLHQIGIGATAHGCAARQRPGGCSRSVTAEGLFPFPLSAVDLSARTVTFTVRNVNAGMAVGRTDTTMPPQA